MIPIYRAKTIHNNDEYLEGYLSVIPHDEHTNYYIRKDGFSYTKSHWIDPSTLAIHFPDMIDSQGNKIFASLSEDGKGGDKINLTTIFSKGEIKTACYRELGFWLIDTNGLEFFMQDMLRFTTVQGIQQ